MNTSKLLIIVYSIFCTLLCLIIAGIPTHAASALDINTIRFGNHPDKIRLVIEISDVTDFRAFSLSSPYRIIVDLPSFNWKTDAIDKPEATMVSNVRYGTLVSGVSRIVLDLKQPALIQSAFILPKTKDAPNRLVIDYKPANKTNFEKNKSTIHGTLHVADYALNNDPDTTTEHAGTHPFPPKKPDIPKHVTQHNTKKPLIIIDPGHGGNDPGALGANNIREKNIVLALSLTLKDELESSGQYRVKMTRDKDIFIRLKDRVKFARDNGGDLFVSIHADSINKPDTRGTSIYTLSQKASDAQTAMLAEKENRSDLIAGVDLKVDDEQVAFILGDFLMTDTMNQSKYFANTVVSTFQKSGLRTLQSPHRHAGFAVLKAPDIPSVLIEAGFVSNRSEAELLNQPAHRKKMAKAIHNSIDSYFKNITNNE